MLEGFLMASRLPTLCILLICAAACRKQTQDSSTHSQALDIPFVSPTEYLRQLSFDLRGRPPTLAELQNVQKAGAVGAEVIDQMLRSDDFLAQVTAWHSEILWPNLNRYRVKSTPVAAFNHVDFSFQGGAKLYDIGRGLGATSPDPLLAVDATARDGNVVAVLPEEYADGIRGGGHAWENGYCDLQRDAEYPDPSVIGTPANRYTITASQSGDGSTYTETYYSEDAATYGLVRPYQDYMHCPNFCRRNDCTFNDSNNYGPSAGCFADMDTPGDDPSGRHRFDTPGMRCADGYVREINQCDFWKGAVKLNIEPSNGMYAYGIPRAQRFTQTAGSQINQGTTSYNSQHEGWRWMEHYWSRGQKVKTCAQEAQEREFGILAKDTDGNPVSCAKVMADSTSFYPRDPSCGCGPKGVFCGPTLADYGTFNESRAERTLRNSIESEPLQIVKSVVDRDEDYLTILTTPRSFVNGALALAWGEQAGALHGEGFRGVSPPEQSDPAWNIPYTTQDWVEYNRPARHSGILTTMEFLVRFPTHRARVAQYRRAFVCSTEFDYAPKPDPTDVNPDIANRNGCSGCHGTLETEGLYFARYPDRTGLYLDPQEYPIQDPACAYCSTDRIWACDLGQQNPGVPGGVVTDPMLHSRCFTWYWQTSGTKEAPWLGTLAQGIYRDASLLPRIDQGPAGMVQRDLAGTLLQACAVKQAWRRLVRREPEPQELQQVLDAFEASGRKYRELVRSVVSSDAYRRAQP
jgi:hypothetical protein